MSTSPPLTSSTKPAPGWAEASPNAQPVVLRLGGRDSKRYLLFYADEHVAEFVKNRVGLAADGQWALYRAIGVMMGDSPSSDGRSSERPMRLVGGVVFHDYHPRAFDIEITAAFDDPSWCSPAALRGILFYPLHTLKLTRCTARVADGNARAKAFLERLGFREEGRLRRASDGVEDTIIYGVLREELMKGFE